MVPTWNNIGLHRSPPLAPVAATDSVARQRSVYGEPAQPTLWQCFASDMMGLLGARIQDSSQARYRQGWASDFHTLFPEGAVLQSVGMTFVHYLYTDQQRSSSYVYQMLSHVSHYYKVNGRCSDALRSPAVLGVKRAVRLDCATRNEDPYPGRKLPFAGDMVAQAIIFHRVRGSMGDLLMALAFRCGFCYLLRASEYLNPSGCKLSHHCILAKHVLFQYRTGLDEMRLVSGADLRRLRIPYERITVHKITVCQE